jgi:hypothetical protein
VDFRSPLHTAAAVFSSPSTPFSIPCRTMKTAAVLLFAWINAVAAAPAVVWKSGKSTFVHSSNEVTSKDVLSSVLDEPSDSAFPAVVFLLRRNLDGSEGLSKLASEGVLPGVAAKYGDAECIHHHVSGMESPNTIVRDAAGHKALAVSLDEFSSKLTSLNEPVQEMEVTESGMTSKAVKTAGKRARELAESNVFVVVVDANTDPAKLDSAVVGAIENKAVGNVVLTSLRSVDEVKHERQLASRRRSSNTGRRLAGDDDGNNNDDANNNDSSSVYYVNMTPNVFAGILFFMLFAVVTWIGISCMGSIQGGDVFATKMPSIGREA